MSSLDTTTSGEILFRFGGDRDRKGLSTGSMVVEESLEVRLPVKPRSVLPSRVAIVGNYSPRQCGIATFTTDLCDAISAEFGATELLALPVNDTDEGYLYPERVRFELSEGNLSSYRQAADFLNFGKIDLVCLQHELESSADRQAVTFWNFCAVFACLSSRHCIRCSASPTPISEW